jgi:hypothetical protein
MSTSSGNVPSTLVQGKHLETRRGRFRHERIAASPSVKGERLIGWIAHYPTGIAFAGVLLGIWGLAWVRRPTIGPALLPDVPCTPVQGGTHDVGGCGRMRDDQNAVNRGRDGGDVRITRRTLELGGVGG